MNKTYIKDMSLISTGLIVLALLLTFIFVPTTARAQTEETNTLVETWLLKNCDAGEELKLQNEILGKGAQLEPAFLEAYNNGPDQKLVSEVESAAGSNYDKRVQMLESGETFGLSEEDLEIAKGITMEDFINQEKEDFILRYKSQALSGLGLVGDQNARELLQKISLDAESPLQVTAQQALKNMKIEDDPEQQQQNIKEDKKE